MRRSWDAQVLKPLEPSSAQGEKKRKADELRVQSSTDLVGDGHITLT